MLTYVQRKLVDEGLLDACVYISTHYGESDQFEDGSTPVEHVASVVRNLCANDQALYMPYILVCVYISATTRHYIYVYISSIRIKYIYIYTIYICYTYISIIIYVYVY
jgi:hypothetical protein